MEELERTALIGAEEPSRDDTTPWKCDVTSDKCDVTSDKCDVTSDKCDVTNNNKQESAHSDSVGFKASVSVNEFRDTIGICQVRPDVSLDDSVLVFNCSDLGLLNYSYRDTSLDDLKDTSDDYGNKSLVSINTEIMEILSDLDSVLETSELPGEYEHETEANNEVAATIDADDGKSLKEDVEPVVEELITHNDVNITVEDTNTNIETSEARVDIPRVEVTDEDVQDSRVVDVGRRRSMRLVSPLQMPAPQELNLSAQLFLESQDPERYQNLRPSSATAAPRERGRRALPPRRCVSLHVQPRANTESGSSSTSSSSSFHSSPFHITTSHPSRHEEAVPNLEDGEEDVSKEQWPLPSVSPSLSLLSCSLSAYSLCRFSLLTLHFGYNFLLQFLLLSLLFGIPLMCLFASLGRSLRAGPLGSWRVAPLFRGLGASLLLSQTLIASYYVAGISWLMVYFKDSFVSQSGVYRWAEPPFPASSPHNSSLLPLSIPSYLSEIVLRRGESPTLPFQSLFHICVAWSAVAIILCKGLSSYGKVVPVCSVLALVSLWSVCVRMLLLNSSTLPFTNWGEFFINSKSWSAAAGECFLSWGLLCPTVWSLCGSPRAPATSPCRPLLLAALLTCLTLLCGGLLATAAQGVIREHHLYYTTTSYEHPNWWIFLTHERGSYPRHASHHSLLLGVCVSRPGADPTSASGLQPLRLATELFPAAMALLTTAKVSSFWAILFYTSLILLSISQLCTITWGITAGLIEICPRALRSRRAVITFACCVGLLLSSLPLARGLELVHLVDYGVVGSWWQCLLLVSTLAAIFLVRGRPYAADALAVSFLSPTSSLVPLLAFTWNVVLPIAMIVLCVVDFRMGRYRQVVGGGGGQYWGGGARAAIALLQMVPPSLVPLMAVIQCWRYLSKGPPDILDRIQLLYRPVLDARGRVVRPPSAPSPLASSPSAPLHTAPLTVPSPSTPPPPPADPPPKYTPPPSYSTATGARLAKILTNTIRSSIRRVRRRLTVRSSRELEDCEGPPLPLRRRGYCSFREKKTGDGVGVGEGAGQGGRSCRTLPRSDPSTSLPL